MNVNPLILKREKLDILSNNYKFEGNRRRKTYELNFFPQYEVKRWDTLGKIFFFF